MLFIHKTTPLCQVGVISSTFYPPLLEHGFEVTAPWFEREREREGRALLLEVSENRLFYFCHPIFVGEKGKKWTGAE